MRLWHQNVFSNNNNNPPLQDESGPRRIDQGLEGRIKARRTNQAPYELIRALQYRAGVAGPVA